MDKEYLIREKPMKALLIFAFPMIVGNLFQQFYTMVDSVVVGRFVGENALAAVGASYSLTNVFISIAIGGGVGASVLTSRFFGSREYQKMKMSVSTALLSFLAVSLTLGCVGLLSGRQIMILLNTPDNILPQATEYLNIYFLGLPFLFMYNVLASMFNALGRSRIPLYLLIFSSVFNIVLDLILVCQFHMGVAGVAWATLIAQGISAVLAFFLFLKEMRNYPTDGKMTLFSGGEFLEMCRIALPSILQQSTVSIGMMLVQSVVNSFGASVLAGYSAGMRIESICIVPMAAMGNVISSYTAQNLGAGRKDRVVEGYHTGYRIVFAFAVILCVILELFYQPLIELFLGDEGTGLAVSTGVSYLRFIGWFFVLIGLKMITDGLLRGAGDMKMFTVANLVNLTIRVVLAVTLAPRIGIEMVWYAVPIGWLANYLISFAEYRTGKWKRI
ncbi:MAG: MATE family efflux transporter [Lachnospiraceae bacterium]|nr:MATE family efflux transporter [Lachnospiraceae bacterium]